MATKEISGLATGDKAPFSWFRNIPKSFPNWCLLEQQQTFKRFHKLGNLHVLEEPQYRKGKKRQSTSFLLYLLRRQHFKVKASTGITNPALKFQRPKIWGKVIANNHITSGSLHTHHFLHLDSLHPDYKTFQDNIAVSSTSSKSTNSPASQYFRPGTYFIFSARFSVFSRIVCDNWDTGFNIRLSKIT